MEEPEICIYCYGKNDVVTNSSKIIYLCFTCVVDATIKNHMSLTDRHKGMCNECDVYNYIFNFKCCSDCYNSFIDNDDDNDNYNDNRIYIG
jgi:hypothetical protein